MSQKKTIIADMVNHPPHYNKGIETSEYINSWEMSYPQGNVIKYVTRYNLKHSDLRKQREDLAKAKWYLNDLIVQLEKRLVIDYFKYHWKQTEEDSHVIEHMKKSFIILDVGCGFNQYKKYAKNLNILKVLI